MTGPSVTPPSGLGFRPDEAFARELDERDALAPFRDRFAIPRRGDGTEVHYFCGNSLGLMPLRARDLVESELARWSDRAVQAHFDEDAPWYAYHELFRESAARLVGARPDEVVLMNSLTVNLHLMLVSFYRPRGGRTKILIDAPTFPSDLYAVQTQIRGHGLDPAREIVHASPRPGEATLREEDLEALLEERGETIALVLLSGVNFVTGQRFDLHRVAAAARARGCRVGFDLAHAAGNVPLALHETGADFAVWCSYKYLNSGPGALGGCFVHERNARDVDLPRFGGWWGNDPATRFRMHLEREFRPVPTADGWQLSNPAILAMAPIRASLELFDEAGIETLRAKSRLLTAFLVEHLDRLASDRLEVLTPRDPESRGCQVSLRIRDGARDVLAALEARGCVCDFREPDAVRVAPVPLYNTFHDVWCLANALASVLR